MSLRNGASVYEVQEMLGHTTLEMEKKYVASLNSEYASEKHKSFSPVKNLKLK
jgi:site-specific recombinase XerD